MALTRAEISKRWRERNPERAKQIRDEYRSRNLEKRRALSREGMRRARRETPEKVKAANRAYRQRHPDRVNAAERARYLRDPTRKLAQLAAYKAANLEIYNARITRWAKANPDKRRFYEIKGALKHCTPLWADQSKIIKFYELARWLTITTGTPHEVDHVVPIRGKNCCGLHVETNLQILTRADNRRKSNKAPA